MPAPPNLPTNHANDTGEFINATDINDLASAVNSHDTTIGSHTTTLSSLTASRTTDEANISTLQTTVGLLVVHAEVSVLSYGADPTGSADSTTAFNNAIAALPASGGVVYVPAGNYKINGIITMGNGSNSAVSTRHGMRLVGAASPGVLTLTNFPTTGASRLFSGAASDMIHVNGPLNGWGIENLQLDGVNGLGLAGLVETSANGGECRNVSIRGFSTQGQLVQSRPSAGGLAGVRTHSEHNSYRNVHFRVPNIAGAMAVCATGANESPLLTSGTNYDEWDNMSISLDADASTVTYGIYLQVVGALLFRHVHIEASTSFVSVHGIVFDYSIVGATAYPADCTFDGVDFSTTTQIVYNVGTPGAPNANRIVNISSRNGRPDDPHLPNLDWGYINATP